MNASCTPYTMRSSLELVDIIQFGEQGPLFITSFFCENGKQVGTFILAWLLWHEFLYFQLHGSTEV